MYPDLTFYIENDRWYADIPTYIAEGGLQGDLEMVSGADTFLSMLAEGENKVTVRFDVNPFDKSDELVKLREDEWIGGAYYKLVNYQGIRLDWQMWLCDVLNYVFYYIPDIIYFRKLS
jgi:hypothetical protein